LREFNAGGFVGKSAYVNFNPTAHMNLNFCKILRGQQLVIQHIGNRGSPTGMKRFPVPHHAQWRMKMVQELHRFILYQVNAFHGSLLS
jgi:hypothetical protein